MPGSVIDLQMAPGAFLNDMTAAITTIANLDTIWVTANVPEKDTPGMEGVPFLWSAGKYIERRKRLWEQVINDNPSFSDDQIVARLEQFGA